MAFFRNREADLLSTVNYLSCCGGVRRCVGETAGQIQQSCQGILAKLRQVFTDSSDTPLTERRMIFTNIRCIASLPVAKPIGITTDHRPNAYV
jgi:hypothetical protein